MSNVISLDLETYRSQATPWTSGIQTVALSVKTIVVSEETFQDAVDLRNNLIDREKNLKDMWMRIKRPLNDLKDSILSLEKDTTQPITTLKNVITAKIESYLDEAKKAKAIAEAAVNRNVTQVKRSLEEEAELLIASGRMEEAAALRSKAAATVAPPLPSAIPQAEGAKTTDKFEWEAEDMMAVIQAVASGKIDLMHEYKGGEMRPLLTINPTVVNALVSRKGMKLGIPGIKVKEVTKIGRKAR